MEDIFDNDNVHANADTNTDNIYQAPISHDRLTTMVTVFRDATKKNVEEAKKDRDYYDGDQISPAIKFELEKRGQPPIYTNKIGSAVSGVLGILDAGESDPEAMPRNYSGQDASDVVTKTLRYISDAADYKKTRTLTSENFVIQGVCAASVLYEDGKIKIDRIRFDDFIYDPYSQELDFSDARYLGIGKMMDADDVKAIYGEAYDKLGKPEGDDDFMSMMDNRKKQWWADTSRKRIRVIDLYYESGGEWHRAVFCLAGMLWAGPSAYHDDEGDSICPIRAATYEIKQDGSRYGMIRNMIPLQDEVNARRSRLLHLTNHRQVQQTDQYAPPANAAIAKREGSKADGAMPFGWSPIAAPDLAQGQMIILKQSMEDLDRMAPTPAVLGRVSSSNESGRARQILQRAGYTELARAFGRFSAFELSIFRTMWFVARAYYDQPMIIRITDDPRAIEFLTINEPEMGMVEQPAIDSTTGQTMIHPITGQPTTISVQAQTGTKNHLAKMDMSIILTTVPDTVTLAQETFDKLAEFAQSSGLTPFDPQFWAMIEMSTLPDKRTVIDRLKRMKSEFEQENAAAQQAQARAAQQAQGVEMAMKQAKAAKDTASAQKTGIEAAQLQQHKDITDAAVAHFASQQQEPVVAPSLWNQAYGAQQFPGY
jgi:hypothetical protein